MVDKRLLIGIIIIIFVILFSLILITRGLIDVNPPLPSESPEKARFIRTLTCAFAMCVRKSCDSVIKDIGFLDKEQEISCYQKCKELESKPNCKEHKCGRDCSLEYKISDEFTYNANYPASNSIKNDVLRKNYWYNTVYMDIDKYHCFWGALHTVTLDGKTVDMGCQHNVGTIFAPIDFDGLCEGSLRSSNGCNKGYTPPGVGGDSTVGTGHIWIDTSITSQCKEFNKVESVSSGTKYYGSCTFKDQTIYVWTEPEKSDDVYCPELVVCSNS